MQSNANSSGENIGPYNPPKDKRFSKTRQPSREARAAGQKGRWTRKNLLDRFCKVFDENVEVLHNGKKKKMPGWESLIRLLKASLAQKDLDKKPLSGKDFDRIVKLIDLIAVKEKSIDIRGSIEADINPGSIPVDAKDVKEAIRSVLHDCLADNSDNE